LIGLDSAVCVLKTCLLADWCRAYLLGGDWKCKSGC